MSSYSFPKIGSKANEFFDQVGGWFGGKNASVGRPLRANAAEFDVTLLWVVAVLVAVGLLMVYSSSIASASESRFTRSSPAYFLVRQSLFVVIGAVLALFVFDTSMRTWERIAPFVFIAASVLILLVLFPRQT